MKEPQYTEVIAEITDAQQLPRVLEFQEFGFLTEHLENI